MKTMLVFFALLWASMGWPSASAMAELHTGQFPKQAYPGSKDRDYLVYVPQTHQAEGPLLPLVVVLHGCNQTHQDIMAATRFNTLAEEESFVVAYPFITTYDGMRSPNCWGFWFNDEIHQGRGEVADIAGIIDQIRSQYRIDPQRVHIVGLSSGGAMATAVMVAYSEIVASGSPAAGLAYEETECAVRGTCFTFNLFKPSTWFDPTGPRFQPVAATVQAMAEEMQDDRLLVPILLLHSMDDKKVEIDAAQNNAQAWASLFHVDLEQPVLQKNGQTEGRSWTHLGYGPTVGPTQIETHFVKGARHAWIGAGEGPHADPEGPDWTRIAWEFFKTHPKRDTP